MCNYFLMIKKQRKAYVVLGTAIPDGMSAYVLTDDDGVQKLHNPCDGQVYDVNDSSCPLKDISMIFNNDNVRFSTTPAASRHCFRCHSDDRVQPPGLCRCCLLGSLTYIRQHAGQLKCFGNDKRD